ncbi:MAG: 16S rRNA (uracil(1498)-N(3))-methyltransferase [Candidatus Omnitrophica bacterium]|nr:16S rRNA (uracil(1498)-N(3))-methyltransferase [Candidatus Omnitrophota bacterium]
MNVLLLDDKDFVNDTTVRLSGRRVRHLTAVLKSSSGDILRVGRLGGQLGKGTVQELSGQSAELSVVLDQDPPDPLPLTLILALPRPIVLNRMLAAVTTLGIKRLYLIHSHRVEKSYWCSPVLAPEKMDAQCRLGLEQAVDTIMPVIEVRTRFKPFVEDELPGLIQGTMPIVAHPGGETLNPGAIQGSAALILGPEGGFIPYELDHFRGLGMTFMTLGERVLKVETAVTAAVSVVGQALTKASTKQ